MNPSTTPRNATRYSGLAIFFHWAIAVLIVAAFILGLSLDDMKFSPAKLQYISYHKWMGISVLGLVALRLVWRLIKPAPALPEHGPAWQNLAAHITHIVLYILMFGVPIAGWLYSSASGYPVVYLSVIPLPDLIAADKTLKEPLMQVHALLAYSMAALVGLHVLAALKHQFFDKDGLLGRMIPGLG